MTSTVAGADTAPRNQRQRILDEALRLMAAHGAGATSMRQLARACDLNVAALYHYFPSKADLLRSVIEERQYALRLRDVPQVDAGLPPRERLAGLIMAMWHGAVAEEEIWRLLLGEGLRNEDAALAVGHELLGVIEAGLRVWLTELFATDELDPDAVTELIIGALFSFFIGHLFRPEVERQTAAERQAALLARLVFP